MGLRVYNTLGRKVEDFAPVNPPRVGMYVCGPTVYGHSHLGHAKTYVAFDAIVRWLRFSGYDLTYVQNITDVGHLTDDADEGEDKVIAEARRRGLHPMGVVEIFMRSYLDDMDALNIVRPDIMPRATGHVPEQIEAARQLIENGHAYEVNGSVYFDVSSFPDYGKLSGRNTAELESGARVAVSAEKRHPADFALWKRAEPGHIMRWPSPWGFGFPGWHLECSVMSQKYIGDTLDIHGGGLDNQFPHHECEIAQAESLTGKPFVRYWLHNNMCTMNGQKMSKSLGNTVLLKELFYDGSRLLEKTFEPVVVKHLILTGHYRAPLDFSNEALKAAEAGCYKLRDALLGLGELVTKAPEKPSSPEIVALRADAEKRFTDAMNDDFNTAAAIAVLFEFTKHVNIWIQRQMRGEDAIGRGDAQAAFDLIRRLTGDALGLKWALPQSGAGGRDDVIQILADLRNEARQRKDFALSDQVRDRLAAIGVNLKDTPEGTKW